MVFREGWLPNCKARTMVALIVVVALWATLATAGMIEGLIEAAKHGDLPEVKRVVAKAAEINAKDNNGATALMLAPRKGRGEVRELLIKAGAK